MPNTEIGAILGAVIQPEMLEDQPANQQPANTDTGFVDNQCPICNGRGFVNGHVCTHPVHINTDKDVQD